MSNRTDLKISLVFLILSLLVGLVLIPTISEQWRQGAVAGDEYFTLGPRFFPGLSAILLGIVSFALLIESLRGRRRRTERVEPGDQTPSLKPVAAAFGVGVAYVVAMPWAGAFLATPLCLVTYFFYFGNRNWFWLFVFPVIVTGLIYLIFETLMMVPLPEGMVL